MRPQTCRRKRLEDAQSQATSEKQQKADADGKNDVWIERLSSLLFPHQNRANLLLEIHDIAGLRRSTAQLLKGCLPSVVEIASN